MDSKKNITRTLHILLNMKWQGNKENIAKLMDSTKTLLLKIITVYSNCRLYSDMFSWNLTQTRPNIRYHDIEIQACWSKAAGTKYYFTS